MNTTGSFTIKKALGYGYAMYKEHPWLMIAVFMINVLILSMSDVAVFFGTSGNVLDILDMLSFVLSSLTILGTIFIALKLYDGKDTHIDDIVSPVRQSLPFFFARILFCLMVLLGLIVFIVPGVYIYLKYQFFGYAMVYKNMGIEESFKESGRITEGELMHLLKYQLCILLINIVGFLTIIGFFITVPLSYLTDAYVYRRLSTPKQEDEVDNEAKNLLAAFEKNTIAAPGV